MTQIQAIIETLEKLPVELQQAVAVYAIGLQQQHQEKMTDTASSKAKIAADRRAGLGEMRDKIWMADDFNAPLADFADY